MTIDELESLESLTKIKIKDTMRHIGWGALNPSKTTLILRFRAFRLMRLLKYWDTLTFRVYYKGYTAINGNASHRVEVRLDLKVPYQMPKKLLDEILIAKVPGKLKDFSFVMKADEIKDLLRKPAKTATELRLVATQQEKGTVRITWEENGSIPEYSFE